MVNFGTIILTFKIRSLINKREALMIKRSWVAIMLVIMIMLSACSNNAANEGNQDSELAKDADADDKKMPEVYIERVPAASDFSYIYKDVKTLPKGDRYSNWGIDIRSSDISADDIMDRYDDLLYTNFDSKTKWPEKLPQGFYPEKVMDLYKDPGLNVRELHKSGITGKGVGIAILDQSLLVDHIEYKEQLRFYEEDDEHEGRSSSMHGPAVASIAVGKTVGVAPEADLYFIASSVGENVDGKFVYDYAALAKNIERIIEINKELPLDRKIRVISISLGFNENNKSYAELAKSISAADKENIKVINVGSDDWTKIQFMGVGREPLSDANNFSAYRPGLFWQDNIKLVFNRTRNILIPMDFRCIASPTGQEDYAVYISGGMSWAIPYLAGTYALACQVNPEITYDKFVDIAYSTGETIMLKNSDGSEYKFEKIINPVKLIEKVKEKSE